MRLDEGSVASRFGKHVLFFGALMLPIFAVTWGGWKLGEWVVELVGYAWLQGVVGLTVVILTFAAVMTAFGKSGE